MGKLGWSAQKGDGFPHGRPGLGPGRPRRSYRRTPSAGAINAFTLPCERRCRAERDLGSAPTYIQSVPPSPWVVGACPTPLMPSALTRPAGGTKPESS